MAGFYGEARRLIPSPHREYKLPAKDHPPRHGHARKRLEPPAKRGTGGANFDYSGPLTEVALLGNVAIHYPAAF
jgi:hypothetical protein